MYSRGLVQASNGPLSRLHSNRGAGLAGERHARGGAGDGHVSDGGYRCRGVDHEAALDGGAGVAGLVDGAHADGVRAAQTGRCIRAGWCRPGTGRCRGCTRIVAPASLENVTRAVVPVTVTSPMVATGAVVSITKLRSTAAPVLPAWSMARTRTVWFAVGEAGVLARAGAGLVRAVVEAALESWRRPRWRTSRARWCRSRSRRPMVATGAVVSITKLRLGGSADVAGLVDGAHPDGVVAARTGRCTRAGWCRPRTRRCRGCTRTWRRPRSRT